MKEEQLYAKAIKEKVSLSYTKIIALGPGQVGKSTFVRRLLGIMKGNFQTALLETQPQSSTGILESREACIQYSRVTGAIANKKWCVLQDELHSQLSGLMSLINQQSQQDPEHEIMKPLNNENGHRVIPIASNVQTVKDPMNVAAVQLKEEEKHAQVLTPHSECSGIKSVESLPVTTQEPAKCC